MKCTFPVLSMMLLLSPALVQAGDEHADHGHHAHSSHSHDEHAHHGHGDAHREHGAHVHGEGRLTVAMQGKTLELMLQSPADSLFGFEHAPTSAQEKAHASQVITQLKDAANLFSLDAAAECHVLRAEVDAPFAQAKAKSESAGHADVEATYVFECKHPGKLNTLQLPLRKAFPALQKQTVEYVTDNAQGTQTLGPTQSELPLK